MSRKLADAMTEAALKLWRGLLSTLTPTGMAHDALVLVRAASKPGHARVSANAARYGRF